LLLPLTSPVLVAGLVAYVLVLDEELLWAGAHESQENGELVSDGCGDVMVLTDMVTGLRIASNGIQKRQKMMNAFPEGRTDTGQGRRNTRTDSHEGHWLLENNFSAAVSMLCVTSLFLVGWCQS
jgi:hypothetical protein